MILNRKELLDHGLIDLRKKALEIIEYSLKNVDPYLAVKNKIIRKGNLLNINGELTLNLDSFNKIYIIGAGKATHRLALGLEEIIGDRIEEGLIVVKDSFGNKQISELNKVKIFRSSHPIPDQRSCQASKKIFNIAYKAEEKDLVFCLITGGSSSLCSYPVPDIDFSDKQRVNQILLKSGADVKEINTIRKHLSQIKGGRLGLMISPAVVINLTVSDGIGDSVEGNTDWTSPDLSTFEDAINVINKYKLWDSFPERVNLFFNKFEERKETVKYINKDKIKSFMLIKSRELGEYAKNKAENLGFNVLFLTSFLNGESREAGRVLTSIAQEVFNYNTPISSPGVIIACGETTVKINDNCKGIGGPNQELTIGGLLNLKGKENIVITALDSDGNDGSTHVAGAMVDINTINIDKSNRIEAIRALETHNVTEYLLRKGDALITNETGTNVNDLILILIGQKQSN